MPIPAELVSLLRTHLGTFGTGEARRVFHNERGGPFNEASAAGVGAGTGLGARRGAGPVAVGVQTV
ncbi:MAG: hypothetical protein ACRDOY_03370 [Nocardioidaceae bacterium]